MIIEKIRENGKYTAAICAAPTVLHAIGGLEGKTVTSFPGVRDKLTGADYSEERVVVDGKLITSRSPGTAMEFAFKILEILEGKDVADSVNQGVLARL
jgi:4-methyl-5(b-hydroxyethyl)-thiazole monophosphate biosynthesis